MEDLISIIVPVYNVERYLKRCVESILNQSYTNIELLLIDDGSKDKSGAICDEYAKKDGRVKVVHKENGGVSIARNLGIEMAQGKYIIFVDSDDWISELNVETHIKALKENDCQLTFSSWEMRGLRKAQKKFENKVIELFNKNDNTGEILISFNNPWNKLFVTEIIKSNQLKFPVGVKYGEDTYFVWKYLMHCKKICLRQEVLYFYNLLNLKSATRQSFKNKAKWLLSDLEVLKQLVDLYDIKDQYKVKTIERFLSFSMISGVYELLQNYKNNKEKILDEIRKLLDLYEPYIFYCEKHKLENNEPLEKSFYTRDPNYIYEKNIKGFRKGIRKERLLSGVYWLAKTFVKPYLEKHRDGLIK